MDHLLSSDGPILSPPRRRVKKKVAKAGENDEKFHLTWRADEDGNRRGLDGGVFVELEVLEANAPQHGAIIAQYGWFRLGCRS